MIDIDQMEAGREMDALVWQALNGKKLGLLSCRYIDGDIQPHAGYPTGHISPLPFSTNVNAAWEAVEKLRDKGFIVRIHVDSPENSELVSCSLHKPDLYETMVVEWIDDTMPLAVCGAALKASERG